MVLRADSADALRVIHGATAVAGMAATFQRMTAACTVHPAIVNGGAGLVNTLDGKPFSIMNFTVVGDRIAAIDLISDRDRLSRLDLTAVVG